MDRYLCIHGHFYQPPRENPWLGAIELQDSAAPFHDWNTRIDAECYAPNARSRILDGSRRIREIVNNYARISYNVGPTLLAWMQESAPATYRGVLDADAESAARFGGHGSAMAQAYNHMIMPLANRRDKRTQVIWGIRDFTHRFRRPPEGMWLPETAVDLETLDILAEHGIRFTVLTPYQVRRVRRLGGDQWHDVGPGGVDPRMPYLVHLPSGRRLTVYCYDGPLSRAVAFEGLLSNGEHFANRLLSGFDGNSSVSPQLVHIATDGETYGHHHHHGDMALAYALSHIESKSLARLTNYGEHLERFPPTHAVEIVESTSWSCAHGVERWRSDCGCSSGGRPGWNQRWRGPLREALDWLRDALAPQYEQAGARYLRDPWAARDDYVDVVLDRSVASLEAFLARHVLRPLTPSEQVTALKLLELQRHAMLMYTSCGWFFDELSGIETVQCLEYAGRAVQLARELFNNGLEARYAELLDEPFVTSQRAMPAVADMLEDGFLARLEQAGSNLPEVGNGRQLYEDQVRPAMVDLVKVGAHYAVSSLFEEYPRAVRIYGYSVELEDRRDAEAGRARLAVGRARFTSEVTRESALLSFGVLDFGDHNINGGVRHYAGEKAYEQMVGDITQAFDRAEFASVIRGIDRHFGTATYSLRALFRDEQRRVLRAVVDSTLAEAETMYRQLYEHHAPLMRFLANLNAPLPSALKAAVDVLLNIDLRRAMEDPAPNLERVCELLGEVRLWKVPLDPDTLSFVMRRVVRGHAEAFRDTPADFEQLTLFDQSVQMAQLMPFEVDLWRAQNAYWDVLKHEYASVRARAERGDSKAVKWAEQFRALGERLRVRLE